ncbi:MULTISPECIES: hypothetical protein [Enterococcus]|uniref:hypothetical protein n=1 Tax=Enterococcus TaxID=1350 RepID=UPI000F5123EF|nr:MULTISPECIES: hypothetical protein [Enterococcus]ROZ02724.1 hypothetical protein EGX16_15965 [Enterococcus gallinarum]ROZ09229.1 hypothetical protein EGX22_15980 [Enterococcus gallinarum]ROZ30918.1 hypothetical protein EGX24_17195 [Enterococcus gallinarum]RXV98685.1 hypothetical protein CYQ16_05365 [Enterococcus faecalis]
MNEKIQMLLQELQQECEKEGVSALCTLNKGGSASFMSVGTLTDIGFCLAVQEKNLDKHLPLPAKMIRNAGIAALKGCDNEEEPSKQTHTFMTDDPNDVIDILSRALRGEFE